MIDYFLQFNTEADAITAATGTALGQTDQGNVWHWNTHFVLPGVQAWRPSQDVTSSGGAIIHTYLTGWYTLVSMNNINTTLSNHPNLAFCLDRTGPPYVIKNNIGAILTDIGVQPIFAGSHYPVGGIS